jgi:putative transposase
MKKRFTEAQIVGFLREVDAGVAVKTCVASMGFRRRAITSGGRVRRDERLGRQALEGTRNGNTRLKKFLAESLLENEVTREALRRKW